MAEIYYTNKYTDENGIVWLNINGDTDYNLDKWTEEEAKAAYLSVESELKRLHDTYEAWGFYD